MHLQQKFYQEKPNWWCQKAIPVMMMQQATQLACQGPVSILSQMNVTYNVERVSQM